MKSLFSTFFLSYRPGLSAEVSPVDYESVDGNPVKTLAVEREYLSGSRASVGNEYLDPADRKDG
jgi:hypothetical protein